MKETRTTDEVTESEFPDDVRNGDEEDLPETYSDDGDLEGLPFTQCNLILMSVYENIPPWMPLCTSPVSAHELSVQVLMKWAIAMMADVSRLTDFSVFACPLQRSWKRFIPSLQNHLKTSTSRMLA